MRVAAESIDRRRRSGATTVEVALTLPILFLLTFAGWEFSRINTIRNTIENAAYEAARASMLPGADLEKVEEAATDVLSCVGIAGATVTMTPSVITTTTDDVTITISAPLATNSLGFIKYFTSGNMTSTLTMSRELQPGRF